MSKTKRFFPACIKNSIGIFHIGGSSILITLSSIAVKTSRNRSTGENTQHHEGKGTKDNFLHLVQPKCADPVFWISNHEGLKSAVSTDLWKVSSSVFAFFYPECLAHLHLMWGGGE